MKHFSSPNSIENSKAFDKEDLELQEQLAEFDQQASTPLIRVEDDVFDQPADLNDIQFHDEEEEEEKEKLEAVSIPVRIVSDDFRMNQSGNDDDEFAPKSFRDNQVDNEPIHAQGKQPDEEILGIQKIIELIYEPSIKDSIQNKESLGALPFFGEIEMQPVDNFSSLGRNRESELENFNSVDRAISEHVESEQAEFQSPLTRRINTERASLISLDDFERRQKPHKRSKKMMSRIEMWRRESLSFKNVGKDERINFDYDENHKDILSGKDVSEGQMTDELWLSNEDHFNYLEKEHTHKRSSRKLIKAVFAVISDFIQTVLSLSSVIIYILQTYNYRYDDSDELALEASFGSSLFTMDAVVTGLGTMDYVISIYEAKHKWKHVRSITAIIDLVTMIPFYISINWNDFQSGLNFLHILQIFKILRVLRLWRLFKEPSWEQNEIDYKSSFINARYFLMRQAIIFCCSIVAVVFICSGIFKEFDFIIGHSYYKITESIVTSSYVDIESITSATFTIFDGFYIMSQTLFTAGIGDVIPSNAASRILLVVAVMILIVVIYDQVGKLRELFSKVSPHDFEYSEKGHVIVMGEFNEYSVYKFLYEAYSSMELHSELKKTLIVSSKEPSEMMMSILQSDLFGNNVKYIVTSLWRESLMSNCNLTSAKAIFMLNDHVSVDRVDAVDGEIMLIAKAIHDVVPYTRKIIQVNNLRTSHCLYKQMNYIPLTTIYPTRFIKCKLLATAVFCQGVTTMIGNFLNSNALIPSISNTNEILWYLEYGKSIKQEIFCVRFSDFFTGLKFNEVCEILFVSKSKKSSSGVLLIGVKSINEQRGFIMINPYGYTVKEGDFGLVIANDIESAEFLTFYARQVDLSETGMIKHRKLSQNDKRFKALNYRFKETIKKEKEFRICMPDEMIQKSFRMWFDDLNGKVFGHIILICPIEYFFLCGSVIRKRSNKPILYVNDKPPDNLWERNSIRFMNCFYCQMDLFDLEQLNGLAINDASHVLILSVIEKSSISPDSTTLLLVNTLDCFFDVPYTFELYDENQMRFIGNRARGDLQHLRYINILDCFS